MFFILKGIQLIKSYTSSYIILLVLLPRPFFLLTLSIRPILKEKGLGSETTVLGCNININVIINISPYACMDCPILEYDFSAAVWDPHVLLSISKDLGPSKDVLQDLMMDKSDEF